MTPPPRPPHRLLVRPCRLLVSKKTVLRKKSFVFTGPYVTDTHGGGVLLPGTDKQTVYWGIPATPTAHDVLLLCFQKH